MLGSTWGLRIKEKGREVRAAAAAPAPLLPARDRRKHWGLSASCFLLCTWTHP